MTVGDGAYTAAGSTITDDVPADSLAIARSPQVVKKQWAAKRRNRQEVGALPGDCAAIRTDRKM